jgi:RNA polymerase sigma factor (sigma-70 family)
MESMSLVELLRRCAVAPEHSCWNEFVRRFGDRLRGGIRSAYRHAGCRCRLEDLEDLLQETYCRLLRQDRRALRGCRGRYDAEIEAYLHRLAQRVAYDHLRARGAAKRGWDLRKQHSDSNIDLDSTPGSAPGPERRLLWREQFALLESRCRVALAGPGLKTDMRLLRWVFVEGLSSREISRRLAGRLAPSGVDTRLYRLRLRLANAGVRLPRRRPGRLLA